ncbi:MATE family efflux transporter [Marinicellulosiphila megalodicopiae]|uniref:MATE family efflux transporter n=1 Tax=Marinicellulosiphila megalodicopiae TaxID=2724896 RepID=UPI003BAEEAAA
MTSKIKHKKSQTSSVMDKSLLSLTWPIFVDTLMVFLINVADAWFLSQQSDDSAAAVGAILPITGMCFSFFVALNAAGAAVATKLFGKHSKSAQNENNIHSHIIALNFGAILGLCFITGIVISAVLLMFNVHMAALMGLSGDALLDGSTYLKTLGFAALALSIRFGASATLQAYGQTKWNMACTAVMTVVNLFFNYTFMYGAFGLPKLGVQGVALATDIAWIVNLILTFAAIYYLQIKITLPKTIQSFKKSSKAILDIAIPSAIEPQAWHLSQLVIMSMIVNLGQVALATRVYAFNIIFIVVLFTVSLSAGVQLKVSYLYGAEKYKDMHNTLIKGVLQGLALVVVTLAFLYVFSASLLGLFSQNPEIIALGSTIIGIAVFAEVGRILNMVIGFSVKVVGHAKFIAVFGISTMWLISLPFTWFLGVYLGFGLIGIWIAMGIDECFRGSVATWYWYKKQNERLLKKSK